MGSQRKSTISGMTAGGGVARALGDRHDEQEGEARALEARTEGGDGNPNWTADAGRPSWHIVGVVEEATYVLVVNGVRRNMPTSSVGSDDRGPYAMVEACSFELPDGLRVEIATEDEDFDCLWMSLRKGEEGKKRALAMMGRAGVDLSSVNRCGQILADQDFQPTKVQELLLRSGTRTTLFSFQPTPGGLYEGAATAAPPHLDGSDAWPVWGSTTDGTGGPKVGWSEVSIDNGTITARAQGPFALVLQTTQNNPLRLPMRDFVVIATVSGDGLRLENGTIAGTMDAQELTDALYAAAGVQPMGPTLIVYADVASSGVAGDACDRLSFGFGFAATKVSVGDVIAGDPPK
jgi:hypothetical protein